MRIFALTVLVLGLAGVLVAGAASASAQEADETLDELFGFLLGLATALDKRVDLTDEGDPDRVIFVALPGTDSVSYVL